MTDDRRPILLPASNDEPTDEPKPTSSRFETGDELPMAPPQMWTRGFLIVCGVVTLLTFFLLHEVSQTMESAAPFWAWLAPLGIVVGLVGIRKLLMPRSPRVIRFGADAVELPRGRNSRRTTTVAYEDIRTIVPLVSRGRPALVIDGPRRTHIYIAPDFPHPEMWRVLWASLVERISSLPDAQEQFRRMQKLAGLSQRTSSVDARFTKFLFWTIGVIFAAQFFLAPAVDILEFLYFGANSRVLVFDEGQIWRVVTANLLHGNLLHFGINAFALYFLGIYSERLFGEARTVVLTLGTALAGATASLIGTEALFAVGISTALFGLLGAYFALHLRFGTRLPPPYRQSWLWWGFILGLNGVLSVAVPVIDFWGHAGGFVAGVALGWWMTRAQTDFVPHRPTGRITNLVAVGLIALFVGCAAIATGYALSDRPDDEVAIANALLDRADQEHPSMLAQHSYQWAGHSPRPKAVNPILVQIAEKAYDRSDDPFVEERASITILWLSEDMDDPFDVDVRRSGIVRYERYVWTHDAPGRTQVLPGLLVEYLDHAGPLHAVGSPFEEAEDIDGAVRLGPEAPSEEARRVYVVAMNDPEEPTDAFLLYRCVPAGDATGAEAVAIDGDIPGGWTLKLAMVTGHETCRDDEVRPWTSQQIETMPDSTP